MNAELIAVGSELLRFGRRDTNGEWLTERLNREGIEVVARSMVEDDAVRIAVQVRAALERADLIVLTGGLGPTEDDRTRAALALALARPLETDPEQLGRIRSWFEKHGRPFSEAQARQAERPRGAQWIPNPLGTAPGLLMQVGAREVYALPGVPAEMKAMFEEAVRPRLAGRPGALATRTFKVAGRTESSVDAQLRDLYETPEIDMTILTGGEGIELHVRARSVSSGQAARRLAAVQERLERRLGVDLYGTDDDSLPAVVGGLLRRRGATVATAESCTAGSYKDWITSSLSRATHSASVTWRWSTKRRTCGPPV